MIQMTLLMMLLLVPKTSNASEKLEKGTVLKEDSIVFTIEEAERLKQRVFELEKKEKELEETLKLLEINKSKIDIYKINEDFYIDQSKKYIQIIDYQDKKIDNYRKIETASNYRNAGIFILGAAVTVGSILIADKVNDSIDGY